MQLEEDFGVEACGPKSEECGQERYIIKCCLLHLYRLFCLFVHFSLLVCGGVHVVVVLLIRIISFLLWEEGFFFMVWQRCLLL